MDSYLLASTTYLDRQLNAIVSTSSRPQVVAVWLLVLDKQVQNTNTMILGLQTTAQHILLPRDTVL